MILKRRSLIVESEESKIENRAFYENNWCILKKSALIMVYNIFNVNTSVGTFL